MKDKELETQLKNILKGGKSKNKYFGLDSGETFDMAGGNNPGFKAFLDLKKLKAYHL